MLALLFALTAGLVVAALIQLRRQQQLAQLRVDFVSGVSHELRTPLAQIRLFAELLRNGQLRSDQERERSFSIIDEEAQRLTYLVENVLAFARSEHGRNTVVAEPLAMDVEMESAIDAFAPLARVRRARVRGTIEPGLVARVDPRALRQVVLNLLDNGVKYGPLGQTVNVALSGNDGLGCSLSELLARVQAILRRAKGERSNGDSAAHPHSLEAGVSPPGVIRAAGLRLSR